jgi:hypothetical protein
MGYAAHLRTSPNTGHVGRAYLWACPDARHVGRTNLRTRANARHVGSADLRASGQHWRGGRGPRRKWQQASAHFVFIFRLINRNARHMRLSCQRVGWLKQIAVPRGRSAGARQAKGGLWDDLALDGLRIQQLRVRQAGRGVCLEGLAAIAAKLRCCW